MAKLFHALTCLALVVGAPAFAGPHADHGKQQTNAPSYPPYASTMTREELARAIELDRQMRERLKDPRTDRERCIDEEIERSDGTVTELERRVIELKCSQH